MQSWPSAGPHEQTTEHLRDLGRLLGDPDVGMTQRLRSMSGATRQDRASFWFDAHVLAETAVVRWEALRIHRLASTDDPHLGSQIDAVRAAAAERSKFIESLCVALTVYLGSAPRIDHLLDPDQAHQPEPPRQAGDRARHGAHGLPR